MIALFSSPLLPPVRSWSSRAPRPRASRLRASRLRARLAVVAAVTAATTLVAVSTPARAAGTPPTAAVGASSVAGTSYPGGAIVEIDRGSTEPDRAGIAAAVRKLQPYVHRTAAGTFRVDAPSEVVAGIPAATYARVMSSARLVNADILAGRFVSRSDGRVTLAPALLAPGAVVAADGKVTAAAPPAAEPDPNTVQVNWWGVQIHLNNASATMLIDVLKAAVAVSGLLTLLVSLGLISSAATIPLAIISGILGLVVTMLSACRTDRGLDLDITWIGIGWCRQPPAA